MGEGMQAPVFHGEAALEAFLEGGEDSVSFSSDSRDHYSTGSSLSDLTDDATSSSTTGSPAAGSSPSGHPLVLDACGGPLCELSSLMDQLPIKRGLSKFFSGKSQSFTSISNVRCVEDLAKKETQTPHNISRRRKACRSSYYGGMLQDLSSCRSTCFAPGPCNKTAISKRSPRGYSCASSLATAARRSSSSSSRGLFCSSSKPPPLPVVHKDM